MGGIHALEHVLISMFPLFALADRYDIGGISHPAHPQVGRAAIFIYDGYPGGVGLSARAYEILEDLLRRALSLTAACPCEDGCPSCIHSPKCGSGNKPLDKEATLKIAALLLGMEEPELPAAELCIEAAGASRHLRPGRTRPGSPGSGAVKSASWTWRPAVPPRTWAAGANATAWGCRWR